MIDVLIVLLAIGWLYLVIRYVPKGLALEFNLERDFDTRLSAKVYYVASALTILLWFTEPFHGIPASGAAFLAVVILLGSKVMTGDDLRALQWPVLWLVAGGIALGGGVVASGLDKDENEIRSSTYLWVSDTEFVNWRRENNDRIELVADKELYRPGDMAKVLVPSPYQGETVALMTIERGHILEYKLLTLDSNSEQLNIPILPEYAPNVFVSVVIIKGIDEASPAPGAQALRARRKRF